MRLRPTAAGALLVLLVPLPALGADPPAPAPATSTPATSTPAAAPATAALAPRRPAPGAKAAEPDHRLTFDPGYRRAGPIDGIAAATLLGVWAYLQLGVPLAEEPEWTDAGGFDRSIRDALVASSRTGRNTSATWSDILWLTPMVWASADAIVVPLATDRGNTDVALQLTVMTGEVFAVTGIYARAGQIVAARDRPDSPECARDDEYSATCGGGRTASFPSGHAAGAMAGAGLICAHHLELPLYGHPAPDVGACVIATSMATTSSILRLVADRHYMTDVIAGGGFGFAAGLGLPMLLHYHAPWMDDPAAPVRARIVPSAPGAHGGASIAGVF